MLAFVRRRLLLVVLTTVAVAVLAYLLASLRPVTYTATSVLIVPSGAGGEGPGSANEARSLASTYAQLMPRDSDVLMAVADAVQEPVPTVAQRLSVSPLGDTALLEVEYTSPAPTRALVGSRTATEAFVAGTVTSDTVPRGSVRLVGLAEPDSITVNGGVTPETVPIGIVLGLALGLVLAVAAERANRRVDDAGQVASVLDVPVFELDSATPAKRDALLRLWRDAGPADGPTLVAVTGVGVAYEDVVRSCLRLADGLPQDRVRVVPGDAGSVARPASPDTVVLVPAGAPGSGEPHEEMTRQAALVVLLVPLSTQRSVIRQVVEELQTYGSARPEFVLVTAQAPPMRPGQRGGSRRLPLAVEAAPAA